MKAWSGRPKDKENTRIATSGDSGGPGGRSRTPLLATSHAASEGGGVSSIQFVFLFQDAHNEKGKIKEISPSFIVI